jgi:diaminopropionate ammonia-lyase
MTTRSLTNAAADPARVPAPVTDAIPFHHGLPGYRPTPVRDLSGAAAELGLAAVGLKDESDRFGLPAFKILGASWAGERTLREHPEVDTLVAASAGNHGRAVARVARDRGLHCRIYLPDRSVAARREAIASEGAEVVVVEGAYEDALAQATEDATDPRVAEIADTGTSSTAEWVIDGYATLFDEALGQFPATLIVVPVGVGSLAAGAARAGANAGVPVVGVEPATAACLTASLAAGTPTSVVNPGTVMAGLDCAEISPTAWPTLAAGIAGMVTVDDGEARTAMAELAGQGLAIGECGAAALAALRALASDPACADLRASVGLGPESRALLIATEGLTAG